MTEQPVETPSAERDQARQFVTFPVGAHQKLQQPPPPFAGIPRLKCRGPVCPRNHQAYTADVASRCSVDPKNFHHRWGNQDLTKGVHPIARPLPGPKAALAELIELIELG